MLAGCRRNTALAARRLSKYILHRSLALASAPTSTPADKNTNSSSLCVPAPLLRYQHGSLSPRKRRIASYSTQHALSTECTPEHPSDTTLDNAEQGTGGVVELMSSTISTSSVLNTVRECRKRYPACVLLVRVGDFYELYFDQADDIGGDILGLQVVDKKFRNGAVRFTGFPARSLDRYLEILVARNGKSVALCEQFQEPMGRSFTRKVTRVITPGTMIDGQLLADTKVYNYILSISHLDPGHEEYTKNMDLWRREKAMAEENYKKDVKRILAKARREWEHARQQQVDKILANAPKRRPGRPKKGESIAVETLVAPAFDPDSVSLPDPPVIPPPPSLVPRLSGSAEDSGGDEGTRLGLAWLDLATGDFMTCTTTPSLLPTDLARIRPKEILIEKDNQYIRGLIGCADTSALVAIQAVGQPSITEVSHESFVQWRPSEATSATAEIM
ncbi:MutS protein 1, partial [Dipsacomyces acuminosporus]